MRVCLIFIFFLSATFASSAKSKSQGKQHGMQKAAHSAKEKDDITMDPSRPQVFPTLITFDASSQEHEEEVISGDNTNAKEDDKEGKEKTKKRNAVLMSEEELADLLKKEAEENESVEEREEDDNDMALAIHEDEITLKDEKKLDEAEKKTKYKEEKEGNNTHEEEVEVEKPASKMNLPDGQLEFLEERESSTESELPADRDYAADSGKIIPVQENQKSASQTNLEDTKKKEVGEKVLLVQNMQSSAAGDSEKMADQSEDLSAKSKEKDPSKRDPKAPMDRQKVKSRVGLKSGLRWSEKVEDKGKSDGAAFLKRKTRQQKKNKRSRKHSPRSDETNPVQDQGQLERQESEGSSGENVPNKANRKRNGGKWGPLVGANPVQIRASLDLYPRSRSSSSRDLYLSGAPTDPCENYRCKRGKTCKLDADGKPGCVCQEPLECPLSIYEFEHVCGTDNKTYETSCELFSTKCNLEGTKRGSRLHLDYTGPCKLIPDCVEDELVQFPLRMRDWLKNVLLQLYEHDSTSQNFLTPKQRFRVKKIFENDRRLHAGNHSVVLLAQDFEKNYNMYIYPVHWQFAQLDQHPSDRILSHSELAPLRVPLVPMEHCTSPFFQGCDADKDKQITLKEWTSCFEIKDEDMDVNMLF